MNLNKYWYRWLHTDEPMRSAPIDYKDGRDPDEIQCDYCELDEDEEEEIKHMYKHELYTVRELSHIFDVTPKRIRAVIKGVS